MEIKYYTQPYQPNGRVFCLGDKINEILKQKDPAYNKIWLVSSFIKKSGLSKLKTSIKKALKNQAEINFIVGTNNCLTTYESLKEIMELNCNAKVFRSKTGNSIGAKLYCFESEGNRADVFISSGCITEGGLYKNTEAIVHVIYDLANGDAENYDNFRISMSSFLEPKEDSVFDLTDELLDILIDNGEITLESKGKAAGKKKIKSNEDIQSTTGQANETDIEDELLSIELPTGHSIEVSLTLDEDLSKRFEKIEAKDNEDKHSEINYMLEEETLIQDEIVDVDIDIDIDIEGIDNLIDQPEKFSQEELMDELNQCEYVEQETERNRESDGDQEKDYIVNYEAIDIEQMLFDQSQSDTDEEDDKKHLSTISKEALEYIKTKDTKKKSTKRIVIEEKTADLPDIPKEAARKKFIISSSFNKLNNHGIINAFFIQINKLKGRGLSGEVRMPVASRDFSPEFWGWPSEYKVMHSNDKANKKYKKWITSCLIIDVENPIESKIDMVELYQEEGKTHFNLYSKVLQDMEPSENDIIRVIRCPDGTDHTFQCELIRITSKEYGIWEQFCSNTIKGTERKYGFA